MALEMGVGQVGLIGDPLDFFTYFTAGDSKGIAVGARPAQLRTWGYRMRRVPEIDSRLARCRTQVGDALTRCAAGIDQYLMQRVVPVVPLVNELTVQVIPSRLVAYSYDESNEMPALDRVAVTTR